MVKAANCVHCYPSGGEIICVLGNDNCTLCVIDPSTKVCVTGETCGPFLTASSINGLYMGPVMEDQPYKGRNISAYIDSNMIYLGLDDSVFINVGSFIDTGNQFYTATLDTSTGYVYLNINQTPSGGIPADLTTTKYIQESYKLSTVFHAYGLVPIDSINISPNPVGATVNTYIAFPQYTSTQTFTFQVMDISGTVYLNTTATNDATKSFSSSAILPTTPAEYLVVISLSGTTLGVKPFIY